jgi:hypothetical protein
MHITMYYFVIVVMFIDKTLYDYINRCHELFDTVICEKY